MRGIFKMGDRFAMGMFLLLSGGTVVGLGMTSMVRTKAKKGAGADFDELLAGVENSVREGGSASRND
jgi:hypothetical protein